MAGILTLILIWAHRSTYDKLDDIRSGSDRLINWLEYENTFSLSKIRSHSQTN